MRGCSGGAARSTMDVPRGRRRRNSPAGRPVHRQREAFMKFAMRVIVFFAVWLAASPAFATFHLWQMNELYSNADGSVQFLEMTALTNGQQFLQGHTLRSASGGTTRTFSFETDLPGDTPNGRRMLIATQGFAALGIVTPDYVV